MHAEVVRKKQLFPRLLAHRFSSEGHRLWKERRISELENYFFGHHTPRIGFSSTLNIHKRTQFLPTNSHGGLFEN